MPLSKIFGLNTSGIKNPYQIQKHAADNSFVKNSYNYETANLNRPEHRGDGVHGQYLYCLG